MPTYEWPASDYAIGAQIQATVADQYLQQLKIEPNSDILDIGCGEGSYSTKILQKVPEGHLLGIDRSENMLHLAREKKAIYPNFSVQHADALTMDFNEQFNYIMSFWCLHWCFDLATVYKNIYRALKPGGKVLTIFPAGDDPFVASFQFLKSTGDYPCLRHFKYPVDFEKVGELPQIIATIPFKKAQVDTCKHSILLPSLDIFHKFVNGLAFFQGQIPDDEINGLNEALVKAYDLDCQKKYQGKYWFNMSVFVVTAER